MLNLMKAIANAVVSESIEDASFAETVNENFEIEIAEVEEAFQKVESSVAEVKTKITHLKACRRNNQSLISAFKRSLRVVEGDASLRVLSIVLISIIWNIFFNIVHFTQLKTSISCFLCCNK